MYGVVLRSDPSCDRALIWCEDHGELAFFNGQPDRPDTLDTIEAGDLVQLEVESTKDFRLAKNVELVAADEYPQLADTLKRASGGGPQDVVVDVSLSEPGKILPFGQICGVSKSKKIGEASAQSGLSQKV